MINDDTAKIIVSDAERAGLIWVKSQYSGANGACVEIASAVGKVVMRDSKDPDGPVLLYTPGEFKAFIQGARNGEFDHFASYSG
jgi:hypothetical protein